MENEEEGDDEDDDDFSRCRYRNFPEHLEQLEIRSFQTCRRGFDDGFYSFSLAILRSSFGLTRCLLLDDESKVLEEQEQDHKKLTCCFVL